MPKYMDKFLDQLRVEIRQMSRQSKIYKVLRDELTPKGYWKKKSRGDSKRGFASMREKIEKGG